MIGLQYASIVWNVNEVFLTLGAFKLRYYSLMWLIGLVAGFIIVRKFFKDRKMNVELVETLFIYCFVGILVGARLGHCLFYEPAYYLSSGKHFTEMLLPIVFKPKGGIVITGYQGLASHGGAIGVITGVLLFCRKQKIKFFEIMDMVAIASPVTGCCIRIGNLMNSEIVGKPTGSDYGFVFTKLGEDFPRHPSQLYEAIAYLVIFFIIILIYRKHKNLVGTGLYLGLAMFTIFLFRFFIEFTKEIQVDWESGLALDQGQILSIPFVLLSGWLIYRVLKKKRA